MRPRLLRRRRKSLLKRNYTIPYFAVANLTESLLYSNDLRQVGDWAGVGINGAKNPAISVGRNFVNQAFGCANKQQEYDKTQEHSQKEAFHHANSFHRH